MKRLLLAATIFLAGCSLIPQQFQPTSTPSPSPQTSPSPPSTLPPVTPTPSPTGLTIPAEDAIKQAMATKYSKSIGEVDLTITQLTTNHAWGSVKFLGEMGGGWFLAAKVSGNWLIVADGNGTIDCPVIEPYNFPTSMVSECFDAATQTVITR